MHLGHAHAAPATAGRLTLNEHRLCERGPADLEQTVALLAHTLTSRDLVTDQGRAVLDVVQRCAPT